MTSDNALLTTKSNEIALASATISQINEQQKVDLNSANKNIVGLEMKLSETRRAADEMSEAHKLEIAAVRAETSKTIELMQAAILAMRQVKHKQM